MHVTIRRYKTDSSKEAARLVFETPAGAEESNRVAAEFIKNNPDASTFEFVHFHGGLIWFFVGGFDVRSVFITSVRAIAYLDRLGANEEIAKNSCRADVENVCVMTPRGIPTGTSV
jgi:hypothetical protein